MIYRYFVLCLSLIGTIYLVPAQNATFALAEEPAAQVLVTGTSSLHDWTAEAKKFGIEPSHLEVSGHEPEAIENLYFYVEVAQLDGGRGAAMNTKIQNAFNATKFPLIEYRQSAPALIRKISDNGVFEIHSKGNLTMAGQSREIEIVVKGTKSTGGLILEGQKDLKMSDFDMDPPTAMFGQIVCGDEVTFRFKFHYHPSQGAN